VSAPSFRAERGETLAELLVTIAILGIAIVAIVGGLGDALLASNVHRSHATADTVARSAAETLKDRAPGTWNSAGSYTIAAQSGFSVSVSARCWNGDSPATFGSCPNGDKGLQELTVTANGNGTTETVAVLKRRT
jgi:type II secretory pathway pseudopilin PulG